MENNISIIDEDFLNEAKEYLKCAESNFLTLEQQGCNADMGLINNIFRSIHSLKGSASFMSLQNVTRLSHAMETILNKMREGAIKPEKIYIDALLDGTDQLKSLIDNTETSDEVSIQPIYVRLANLLPMENTDDESNNSDTTTNEINNSQSNEPTLEKSDAQNDTDSTPDVENDDQKYFDTTSNSIFATHNDNAFTSQTENTEISNNADTPPHSTKPTHTQPTQKPLNAPDETDTKENKKQKGKKQKIKNETIRVKVSLLNNLMSAASELVLVRNQQLHLFDKSDQTVRSVVQHLNLITNELQEGIMLTRMQPVKNVFDSIPRIVRTLSQDLNKKIKLNISGHEVEMDKTILEALSDPLTHLIRNCCDHGIESPEDRLKAGKSATGNIWVSAYHEGGNIFVEIKDDGKGINIERIKAKALEASFRTAEELDTMSEKELFQLIFHPGFSTAEVVTNVSGRGVGMDVVKSSIEKLSGTIDIDSTSGKGTSFLLRLPLTLAIIRCLIVQTGEDHFAIPQINIEELVDLYDEEVINRIESTGDSETFRLRDQLLPLVRLSEIIASPKKFTKMDRIRIAQENRFRTENLINNIQDQKKVVGGNKKSKSGIKPINFAVVRSGTDRYGLVVDQILGTEEIVIKPIHPLLKDLNCYAGTTVMGDGRVVLILDTPGIAKHAGITFSIDEVSQTKQLEESIRIEKESQSFLLFKNGNYEQFAIALPLIKRIEEFKKSSIERIGHREFLTVNGTSTLILRLDKYLDVSPCDDQEEMVLILPKYTRNPYGVLVSKIIGIETTDIQLNTETYSEIGLLGTAIIKGRMTMFPDINRLIKKAEPDWFKHFEKSFIAPETKKHVLLVEDCSFFRQLVKGYLESLKYEVITAEDGKVGLECLKNNEFDLIISDIEMPVMDGIEFIRNVRAGKCQSTLPALALSSLDSGKSREKAINSGFDAYEIKIDQQKLLYKVAQLIK